MSIVMIEKRRFMEYIIVSKKNPSIDEIASMYAYCEFINKLGFKATYSIEGSLSKDSSDFLYKHGVALNSIKPISGNVNVILIGDIEKMAENVNKKNVTEIISNQSTLCNLERIYENANIEIEQVSAISTLIAKRLRGHNILISKESVVLLYHAIMMGTNQLDRDFSTAEDLKMAHYLKERLENE